MDLIIQEGLKLNLIEFKAGQTIMPEMFKGLAFFEALAKSISLTKSLVYGGFEPQVRTAGHVIPWKKF